jgi:hypothetical protein
MGVGGWVSGVRVDRTGEPVGEEGTLIHCKLTLPEVTLPEITLAPQDMDLRSMKVGCMCSIRHDYVCLTVRMIQLENRLTDLDEI